MSLSPMGHGYTQTPPKSRTPTSRSPKSTKYIWSDSTAESHRPSSPSASSSASSYFYSPRKKLQVLFSTTPHLNSLRPCLLPKINRHDDQDSIKQVLRQWASYVYSAKLSDINVPLSHEREQRLQSVFIDGLSEMKLNLRDNTLGPSAGYAIAQLLSHDDYFIQLDLSCNQLHDRGIAAIASMLSSNSSIVLLDLRSNDIGVQGGISLCDALLENRTLTHLDIGGATNANRNHIGIRGAQSLSDVLANNKVLTFLSVNGNGISIEGAELLSNGLSENTSLLHFDIGSNGIDVPGCEAICKSILNTPIETLIASRNNIGDGGAGHLEKVIRRCSTLKYLDISSNSIGILGGQAIGQALCDPNGLETLILDRNSLKAQGCTSIFQSLQESFIKLRCLSLANNEIDGSIGSDILQCLKRNKTLTRLDLSGNHIGDEGCDLLSQAISVNSTLSVLDLSYNKIGDDAAALFFKSLRSNTSLTHISFKYNNLKDRAAIEMLECLKKSPHLLGVDLNYNEIDFRYIAMIQSILSENNKRYKKGEVARINFEINKLREDEAYMESIRQQAALRAELTLRAQVEANSYIDKYKEFEREIRRRAAERDSKLLGVIETKQVADDIMKNSVSHFSSAKTEKEHTYRAVVNRLQKEIELRLKVEKKLKQAVKEYEDSSVVYIRKIENLKSEIKKASDAKADLTTMPNPYHGDFTIVGDSGNLSPGRKGILSADRGDMILNQSTQPSSPNGRPSIRKLSAQVPATSSSSQPKTPRALVGNIRPSPPPTQSQTPQKPLIAQKPESPSTPAKSSRKASSRITSSTPMSNMKGSERQADRINVSAKKEPAKAAKHVSFSPPTTPLKPREKSHAEMQSAVHLVDVLPAMESTSNLKLQ